MERAGDAGVRNSIEILKSFFQNIIDITRPNEENKQNEHCEILCHHYSLGRGLWKSPQKKIKNSLYVGKKKKTRGIEPNFLLCNPFLLMRPFCKGRVEPSGSKKS